MLAIANSDVHVTSYLNIEVEMLQSQEVKVACVCEFVCVYSN